MKIWFNRYTLQPLNSLNAKSGIEGRKGALLKIEFSKDLLGYCDLHPHPELGDENLEKQLKSLKDNKRTALLTRSLHWAMVDAQARKKNESLFADLKLPRTHVLVTDLNTLSDSDFSNWESLGYSHVKIKMGRDLIGETQVLKQHLKSMEKFQWRIDFNETLSLAQFQDWWSEYGSIFQENVDYLEDPIPYKYENWNLLQGSVALDRSLSLENLKTFSGPVVIFKPAVSDTSWLNRIQKRVVFSTYMDHPLGEMTAIFSAAHFYDSTGREEVCGLRTWNLFETNEFSEELQNNGSQVSSTLGNGFGFDEQLCRQNWELLQ